MKTIISLMFLIALAMVSTASAQNTKKTAPKTVTDFFYLLPEDQFAPPEPQDGAKKQDLRAYRKSIIKIRDDRNGYLRLESSNWEGWSEIAIFKKTDGKYVIGISNVGCGPVCSSANLFFEYENGNWTDVTDAVWPITDEHLKAAYARHKITEDDEPGLVYELPRVGRKIQGRTDGDREIVFFELTWNGSKFALTEK